MDWQLNLYAAVVGWCVSVGGFLFVLYRGGVPTTGLSLAYIFNLALNHFLGASIYLLPWFNNDGSLSTSYGFTETVVGLFGFLVGVGFLSPFLTRMWPVDYKLTNMDRADALFLAKLLVLTGTGTYFVLAPLLGNIPTVAAVFGVMRHLVVIGMCLAAYWYWREQKVGYLVAVVAGGLVLPLVTIVTEGFLGYGTVAVLTLLAFVLAFYRRFLAVIAISSVLFYVALSFYVTYMRDRNEIRNAVWGNFSVADRMTTLGNVITSFEWFDPYDNDHLTRIDDRLNQNKLVGDAVQYIEAGYESFAGGETLWEATQALVPRLLWPDKPVFAGSPGIVSRYTGQSFGQGTSVGIGAVMEFYINWGSYGVLFGFLFLGGLLGFLDARCAQYLASENWKSFVLWFLPGLALLQVGGSLVEVTSALAASVVAGNLVLSDFYISGMMRYLPFLSSPRQESFGLNAQAPAFHE